MLGTWEGKIEGCNCPSCKECSGKGIPEALAGKSPPKSPKGPKPLGKKVSPKSKITDGEMSLEENGAQKVAVSDSEVGDSESVLESGDGEKSSSLSSDKLSHSCVGEQETGHVEEESEAQGSMVTKKPLSNREESLEEDKLKRKAEGGTSKTTAEQTLKRPHKNSTEEEDGVDQGTEAKQKRVTDKDMLLDPIVIKQEPEEYLSDLDDSGKSSRGRQDKGKNESRSTRRARMVTSEMENIYAKPRMIFTGRGVVRKFEPGIDRTPKSKRGRKPGKALLPINIKQEPKEPEMVKQEVEGNDIDELQRALSEAAENISDVGEELLDAFHELGENKKMKQKKKATPFFKRVEGEGDKYVECSICFKVLKESSVKQHYKTHTGEKPHMCDICQSRFTRKGDVERHKRLVHKSQKPFKCQKCMKEFSDRKNLKAHLQNHDKAIYYGCSTCGFKFGKREYYENHIRYIHPLPDGAVPPAFSPVDDDLATKQLKQLEMEELKEKNAQKISRNRESELEELEEEDDDDDDDMDEEDKAIEITVTEMDEQRLFATDGIMVKKEDKEDSMDGASTNTHEEDEDEDEEDDEEEEEDNIGISGPPSGDQRSKVPSTSSLLQLFKNNPPQKASRGGTNVKVSKGMLSLTQTVPDNDSQGDEDLVDKVIAAAVSQATDTIESLQAKSGANMSGNDVEFGDEEETEEEERLDGSDDLQEILGGPSYEMLPITNIQKTPQQPAEIHITASVSGQQRKFIIQVPPGTNLNVQTPEGMEMIVNIVNQLCAGKGELDGPIEVVMNNPTNRLMLVNNKR